MGRTQLAAGIHQCLQPALESIAGYREPQPHARHDREAGPTRHSQTSRCRTHSRSVMAGIFFPRLAIEFGQNAIVLATDPTSTRLRVYRNEWRGRIDNEAHIMWTGR